MPTAATPFRAAGAEWVPRIIVLSGALLCEQSDEPNGGFRRQILSANPISNPRMASQLR